MKTETVNEYHKQADDFLARFDLGMRITLSDTKPARWSPAGHHYRVTLWHKAACYGDERPEGYGKRLVFDFWGSAADAESNTDPNAYSVLACISGDVNCADTFKDFCADFGYSDDSINALQTFRRCSAFSKRLRLFFTAKEIEAIQEIN